MHSRRSAPGSTSDGARPPFRSDQIPRDWGPGTAVDRLQGSSLSFRPDRVLRQDAASRCVVLESGARVPWDSLTIWRRCPTDPPWPAHGRHPLHRQDIRNNYLVLAHAMHVARSTEDPDFWLAWQSLPYDPLTEDPLAFAEVQERPEVVRPSSLDPDLVDQLPLFMRSAPVTESL